jgi:hypothetical protein
MVAKRVTITGTSSTPSASRRSTRVSASTAARWSQIAKTGGAMPMSGATRRRLLDALLAEALAPADDRELEAAE